MYAVMIAADENKATEIMLSHLACSKISILSIYLLYKFVFKIIKKCIRKNQAYFELSFSIASLADDDRSCVSSTSSLALKTYQ